jgi:type I restriction enzyme S subunit
MGKYPKYKDSAVEWIEEIPAGWTIVPLKSITDVRPSNVDKHIYPEEIQVDLCNYTDVYKNEFVGLKTPLKKGSCSETEYARFNLKKGDVIITKDSESPDDIGIPCLIIDDLPNVVCGYHLTLLRPTNIEGGFLYRAFHTQYVKSYFETESNGITRFALGKSSIESTPIVFPPIQEQQQIVTYLDQKTALIDQIISGSEKKIEVLQEQRTATINHAVTKGLKPKVKMKDSGVDWIGEIPLDWSRMKMKRFAKICNGSEFKEHQIDFGGFPVYGTGGEFARSSEFIYDKISVLLGRKGTIDKPQLVREPFWTSDTVYYTEIKPDVSPFYFYYLVCQIPFGQYVYGSAIPSMTKSVYDEMIFPYPPLQEQHQIVTYLDQKTKEIDDLITSEKKRMELLKEYRQSLISEVVTGKIKVTNE